MAYQAFCVTVVGAYGSKIEVCENREGFLYFREYFRSSYTGCMQAGKWQAVCSAEWNECAELVIDDYVLMQGSDVERVGVTYRLPKGGIVKLPVFERVIGEPKVMRIDGKYNENNGAYELVFARDNDGNILTEDNMYDNKCCYRAMSEAEVLKRFGINLQPADAIAEEEPQTEGLKMANATCLLIDASRGIYIPKTFASNFEGWQGITKEDLEVLQDAYHEYYWETWDDVLHNAYYMQDGNKYTLWQDDRGLFAVCLDMMTEEEQEEFFN